MGWQVHHISNDGNNNTPENLIWIKDVSHNLIPKIKTNKMIEMINSPKELLKNYVYLTILQDNELNKKLSELCSIKSLDEKIDFKKLGIFDYLGLFFDNTICKDEYYKTLFNNKNEDNIEKIKIQFNNFLKEIIEFQNNFKEFLSYVATDMERIIQSERDHGIR